MNIYPGAGKQPVFTAELPPLNHPFSWGSLRLSILIHLSPEYLSATKGTDFLELASSPLDPVLSEIT